MFYLYMFILFIKHTFIKHYIWRNPSNHDLSYLLPFLPVSHIARYKPRWRWIRWTGGVPQRLITQRPYRLDSFSFVGGLAYSYLRESTHGVSVQRWKHWFSASRIALLGLAISVWSKQGSENICLVLPAPHAAGSMCGSSLRRLFLDVIIVLNYSPFIIANVIVRSGAF